MEGIIKVDVAVLGSGPGGYTAAFRAADLGKKVVLIEKHQDIGGVCLNVGCIPSKALLHSAEIINETKEAKEIGISFDNLKIDINTIRDNKNKIVTKLTSGLKVLAKARKVKIINGYGEFVDANTIKVDNKIINFDNCIIATGSRVTKIPIFDFDNPNIMDSTAALDLKDIPKRLLVVGGGIIGLEMACVYDALGSEITVVELTDSLIASADKDIVRPLFNCLKKQYQNIYLSTKVEKIENLNKKLKTTFNNGEIFTEEFDKVLVAVGRSPNGNKCSAGKAGVEVENNGFIKVDKQMRTNKEHIFAIGDVVGQPMLAHKAVHEAKVAAEVICGYKSHFDAMIIPSVAYTNPEIAWVGKTEQQLKDENIDYKKGVFPWAASGRSLSINRNEGLTKALFAKKTKRLLGMGICGTNAGELIAEAGLAIEMGADFEDISLTIHPHPTLSETVGFAAEMAAGSITDLLPPKR